MKANQINFKSLFSMEDIYKSVDILLYEQGAPPEYIGGYFLDLSMCVRVIDTESLLLQNLDIEYNYNL